MNMACLFAAEIAQESINMAIIGLLGDTTALAAVGLGYMIIYMLVMATSFGLNTAIETLVSQAFGAGDHQMCGRYLNR